MQYQTGITRFIRSETEKDILAIHEVHRRAFGQDEEAQLVDALRKTPEFIADLSLVAVDSNKVIGHILFSPIQIEERTGNVSALALAPMAVLPEYQRKGVGSELVTMGLDRARKLGQGIIVVVGHSEYYPRFGFIPAREVGIESPFPVPDDSFLVLALTKDALKGVTGTVKYPPAFGT